ncbi:unnamed protein product [Durusdinium trenchii]|uniref:Uncharacterized protein n=1 Tax=Durusdinium trenchii TaxID=1381693 RepID=A0ABP0NII6_9DINO
MEPEEDHFEDVQPPGEAAESKPARPKAKSKAKAKVKRRRKKRGGAEGNPIDPGCARAEGAEVTGPLGGEEPDRDPNDQPNESQNMHCLNIEEPLESRRSLQPDPVHAQTAAIAQVIGVQHLPAANSKTELLCLESDDAGGERTMTRAPQRFVRALVVNDLAKKDAPDFGLVLSLEVADHGKHQLCKLVLPEKFEEHEKSCTPLTIVLEKDERILCFRLDEVKDKESGFSVYFNPQVVIQSPCQELQEVQEDPQSPADKPYRCSWGCLRRCQKRQEQVVLRLERLSGHFEWPEKALKGQWRQLPELDVSVPLWTSPPIRHATTETVATLRSMRGQERDHLLGAVLMSSSRWSTRNLTGQTAMFWFELLVLDCAAWYFDVYSDISSLQLFASTGMMDYFVLNFAGMMLPMIVSLRDIWHFHATPSPELDALKAAARHVHLSGHWLELATYGAIALQMQMLWLTAWSAKHCMKHSLLGATKLAEVAESACSALIQFNYLLCVIVGVKEFDTLQLSEADFIRLGASITMSCGLLGMGFAFRDTEPVRVLGLPGKLKLDREPFLLAALTLVRVLEVTSQVLAINFVHVSTRFQGFSMGGPAMTLGLALLAKFFLTKATTEHVLAAILAHPGQVLEPRSLMPLGNTMKMKVASAAAVIIAQAFARYSTFSEEAKAIPDWLLAMWFALTVLSWMGLGGMALFGKKVKNKTFQRLADDVGVITYRAVKAAFDCAKEVPDTILMALTEDYTLLWDKSALEELRAVSASMDRWTVWSNPRLKLCQSFIEELGHKGIVEGFSILALHNPEELLLPGCYEIPSDAWGALQRAQWSKLKKVNLHECFNSSTKGAEGAKDLLIALASSKELEEPLAPLPGAHCASMSKPSASATKRKAQKEPTTFSGPWLRAKSWTSPLLPSDVCHRGAASLAESKGQRYSPKRRVLGGRIFHVW